MNLTEIEIQGFKSFKSKFNFKLDKNLIGIVGPNGSGKSNIIDAVRWSLGEQSAKNLRGSNMQDIIFAGTEEHKANNFAEVSLKFNDKHNNSTVVTRRLYRNGDSEYLVNNQKSKLKDITDVYLDLGINKESYSIITQGKVDSIISSKPQDRRIIIEEAAGVLKYKNKRKETYLKLEKTNDNIKRLNDIFIEIESRNNFLFNQKEKTKKYFELKEDYEKKDKLLRVYNIKNLKTKLDILQNEKSEYHNSIDKYNENLRLLENELTIIQKNIKKIDAKYFTLKDSETNAIKENERITYELKLTNEQSKNKEEKIVKLTEEELKINNKLKENSLKLKEINKEIKILEENILSIHLKIKNDEKKDNTSIFDVDKEIELLKNNYFELIKEQSQLQNNIEVYKKNDNDIKNNIELIKAKNESLKTELLSRINEEREKNEQIKTINQDKIAISEKIYLLETKQEKYITEKNKVLDDLQRGKHLLETVKNKLEFLNSKNSNNDFYNQGVKEIFNYKKNISGIHFTVGEILSFNTEYLEALDIILSNSQQNIIVDNPEIARKCIEHLKKTGNGRATFLPLNSINSRKIDNELLKKISSTSGFIGVASDLVNFDFKYKKIVEHLLGNTIVVENLKVGNDIAKIINYRNKIVTLDGQVINSGGSLTGGSLYKNAKSILKIRSEILYLEEKKIKINEKLDSLNEKLITTDKFLISNQKKIEEDKIRVEEIERNKNKYLLELDNIKFIIKNIEENIREEELKITELSEQDKSTTDRNELELDLENVEKKITSLDKKLKELNIEREQAKILEENIKETSSKNNIELSRIKESLKYRKHQKQELELLLEDLTRDFNKIQDEKELLDKTLINIKNPDFYSNKLTEIKEELKNIDIKLKEISIEKDRLYKDEEDVIEKLKVINTTLNNINHKVSNLNISIGKNENNLSSSIAYLVDNYSTTYEKEEKNVEDFSILDMSNLSNIIPDLKSKMDSLGTINLNAIEEFNEVNERYNFYKKEIDDLKNSKSQLENIIFEIDKEVSERFLNTFTKVAINFDNIFKKIFGGGYAKITLDKEKDILNSGINIEVSPPGKKLQKISLLSGGEKSLTAISLLFAILEIKKPPFVILDEVEAALDEDNVSKFASFLEHYSKENIFLVITHRRGTMEVMNKLYGITMKEKGVSYTLELELENILKGNYIYE